MSDELKNEPKNEADETADKKIEKTEEKTVDKEIKENKPKEKSPGQKFLEENIDVVNRSFAAREQNWNSRRFVKFKKFLEGHKKTISIGSGGYEPVAIGTNYALDIAPNCETYLQELNYTGKFILGDCRNIQLGDEEFDCAICSEVIEHLPTMDDIKKTINEVARISRNWIFTIPCNPIGPLNTEPTHKRSFTLADIQTLFQNYKITYSKDTIYFYIEHVEKK